MVSHGESAWVFCRGNGNLFRSITLLAVTCSEQKGCELTDVLTAADLEKFCGMLEFGKFNDKWDVKIEGLGCKHFVSEVEKTVLKESKVGKNIPTVAEVTQGEVVNFVQKALALMAAGGTNVPLGALPDDLSSALPYVSVAVSRLACSGPQAAGRPGADFESHSHPAPIRAGSGRASRHRHAPGSPSCSGSKRSFLFGDLLCGEPCVCQGEKDLSFEAFLKFPSARGRPTDGCEGQ